VHDQSSYLVTPAVPNRVGAYSQVKPLN